MRQSLFGLRPAVARPRIMRMLKPSASGVAVDFEGIPSWAEEITLQLLGVSSSGTSRKEVRVGSDYAAGFLAAGYLGSVGHLGNANTTSATTATDGLGAVATSAGTHTLVGNINLKLMKPEANTWILDGVVALSDAAIVGISAASVVLPAPLSRIRFTMANGTDTFDAGEIGLLIR